MEPYPMLSRGISAVTELLVVVKGYAAWPRRYKGGGGSNFLCLPEDPQWKAYVDGRQSAVGTISGVENKLRNHGGHPVFSESNNGGNPLDNYPAPCAVCYVVGRSTILMVPARTQCPDGWTTEYAGYLVSEKQSSSRKRSSYICWDEAPEVTVGLRDQDQAEIFPVEVKCGTLPCSVYIDGREATCIVCSK